MRAEFAQNRQKNLAKSEKLGNPPLVSPDFEPKGGFLALTPLIIKYIFDNIPYHKFEASRPHILRHH